jgi:glycosyltransferase involved in cell wall biosynthesis
MAVDVSVVVPFFNPGADLEDCVASLLAQTLAADRYEILLMDDGSTDSSGRRADDWARRHEHVSVHHLAASGGPARPRNVGIDRARGRYVQFVDSDDTLAPGALARLLEVADGSDADVVVGKLSSDFRGIYHPLFRETVTRRTLADYPLIHNVTVCKMFRRTFLDEHAVRFPEGPHYIEDQQICIRAYAHARSVAVVADLACYFYRRRRTAGHNHGDTRIVPADYYRELAAIFDVIDNEVEPAARAACWTRYFRNEMLGRLRGAAMATYDDGYRREIATEVRRLATSRIPAQVREALPAFQRAQSRLLLDDDVDGMVAYAAQLETLRLVATTRTPWWDAGRLAIPVAAELRLGDEALRLERDGDAWCIPRAIAPTVGVEDRRVDPAQALDIDLATTSRADSQLWSTTAGLRLVVDNDGCPRVEGEVRIDPATLMGGRPLATGLWDLRLRLMFAGLTRTSPLRPSDGDEPPPLSAWLDPSGSGPPSVTAYWTHPSPTLALDVVEWMHPLQDLLDDAATATARIEGRRRLVVSVQRWQGNDGATGSALPATVVLTALPSEAAPPVHCPAAIELAPGGSVLAATIPRVPSAATGWDVWLRVGEVGGMPPRRLGLTVTTGRLGRPAVAPADVEAAASPDS